jgi:heme-degrading monooxygenase HmoA
MIKEIADIRVHQGEQEAFKVAVQHGLVSVLSHAKGFRRFEVQHCLETPERFVLLITWDTLEDHTVGFRTSPAFALWREIVGRYFASPPLVEHFELLSSQDAKPLGEA